MLGGPFGPEVLDVGEVSQFVSVVNLANQPPTVTLTSPIAGTLIAPASIQISATAADAGGNIAKLEFYSGSTRLGEAAGPPYSFAWNNVAVGTYSISAVATDNLGAKTASAAVTITVTPSMAPTVLLTSPVGGSSFTAPATIALAASATDDGSIAKVEFFAGGTKLGEATTAPYTFNWTIVAAGTYTVTAKATDASGLASISNAVTVTVAAGPPPVSPPGTLTATQLAKCPAVSGSTAQNYYLCMIGGLTGTQLFDTGKTCSLSISEAETVTVSSNGATYSIPTGGSVNFTKSSYLLVLLHNPGGVYPSIDITLKSISEAGKSFFVDGGALQVDAESFDPRPTPTVKTSLSCVFNVPKI